MTYTVSITNQGQISIPIEIRRFFGLDKSKKATIEARDDGTIVVKPVVDLLMLQGFLKTRKKFTSKQIRESFTDYLAKKHLRRR